jgi:peptidoglycan/xylan/chitin deacetylase (PgdA/CDA1 family)
VDTSEQSLQDRTRIATRIRHAAIAALVAVGAVGAAITAESAASSASSASAAPVAAVDEPPVPPIAVIDTPAAALASAVRVDPPDPPPQLGYPAAAWPGPGQVALTFDDGPRAGVTGRVIDILDEAQVGGTFFVVGTMATTWPQLVIRAAESGHSVQNHTWNHPWLSRSSTTVVTNELTRLSNYVESLIGVRPTVFRPPYGATNARVAQIGASLGMSQALWNGGPSSMTASAANIISSVASQARSAKANGSGLVVLFHDGSGSTGELLKALPTVIQGLRAGGWEFVVMEQRP